MPLPARPHRPPSAPGGPGGDAGFDWGLGWEGPRFTTIRFPALDLDPVVQPPEESSEGDGQEREDTGLLGDLDRIKDELLRFQVPEPQKASKPSSTVLDDLEMGVDETPPQYGPSRQSARRQAEEAEREIDTFPAESMKRLRKHVVKMKKVKRPRTKLIYALPVNGAGDRDNGTENADKKEQDAPSANVIHVKLRQDGDDIGNKEEGAVAKTVASKRSTRKEKKRTEKDPFVISPTLPVKSHTSDANSFTEIKGTINFKEPLQEMSKNPQPIQTRRDKKEKSHGMTEKGVQRSRGDEISNEQFQLAKSSKDVQGGIEFSLIGTSPEMNKLENNRIKKGHPANEIKKGREEEGVSKDFSVVGTSFLPFGDEKNVSILSPRKIEPKDKMRNRNNPVSDDIQYHETITTRTTEKDSNTNINHGSFDVVRNIGNEKEQNTSVMSHLVKGKIEEQREQEQIVILNNKQDLLNSSGLKSNDDKHQSKYVRLGATKVDIPNEEGMNQDNEAYVLYEIERKLKTNIEENKGDCVHKEISLQTSIEKNAENDKTLAEKDEGKSSFVIPQDIGVKIEKREKKDQKGNIDNHIGTISFHSKIKREKTHTEEASENKSQNKCESTEPSSSDDVDYGKSNTESSSTRDEYHRHHNGKEEKRETIRSRVSKKSTTVTNTIKVESGKHKQKILFLPPIYRLCDECKRRQEEEKEKENKNISETHTPQIPHKEEEIPGNDYNEHLILSNIGTVASQTPNDNNLDANNLITKKLDSSISPPPKFEVNGVVRIKPNTSPQKHDLGVVVGDEEEKEESFRAPFVVVPKAPLNNKKKKEKEENAPQNILLSTKDKTIVKQTARDIITSDAKHSEEEEKESQESNEEYYEDTFEPLDTTNAGGQQYIEVGVKPIDIGGMNQLYYPISPTLPPDGKQQDASRFECIGVKGEGETGTKKEVKFSDLVHFRNIGPKGKRRERRVRDEEIHFEESFTEMPESGHSQDRYEQKVNITPVRVDLVFGINQPMNQVPTTTAASSLMSTGSIRSVDIHSSLVPVAKGTETPSSMLTPQEITPKPSTFSEPIDAASSMMKQREEVAISSQETSLESDSSTTDTRSHSPSYGEVQPRHSHFKTTKLYIDRYKGKDVDDLESGELPIAGTSFPYIAAPFCMGDVHSVSSQQTQSTLATTHSLEEKLRGLESLSSGQITVSRVQESVYSCSESPGVLHIPGITSKDSITLNEGSTSMGEVDLKALQRFIRGRLGLQNDEIPEAIKPSSFERDGG